MPIIIGVLAQWDSTIHTTVGVSFSTGSILPAIFVVQAQRASVAAALGAVIAMRVFSHA